MKNINGLTLKQMIISGANNLYNHYPEIDALNVFPVPDGDTGTNMNLTITSGSKEVQNRNDTDVYEIAKAFSKGLLMGARGNSGVILSQIFRGFAQSLEGKKVIKPTDLAEAFYNGKEVAYKAVMRPVEGTILTVIREASTALMEKVNDNMSIEKCFEILLNEARESLDRTPELLPVLKEVGVVDSGGAGLIKVLEGFQLSIQGKIVERQLATAVDEKSPLSMAGANVEGDEFGYCTEFIMQLGPENVKKPFVEKRFTNVLASHGNSLVVVRDDDIVKVHVHTMMPGSILTYAQQYGEFKTIKVENMTEQHTKLEEEKKLQQEDTPLKDYALIAVAVGDGVEDMFKELRVDVIVSGGQTMNPSTEDFIAAIKKCHAKNIFIMPNNSNIIMAASQACDVCKDENINAIVIPSKTIPQGFAACMNFNPEASVEENRVNMEEALPSIKTGLVTFAIKDTSIDGVQVNKDQFIGIVNKSIVCSLDDKLEATEKLVESMIDDMTSIITLIAGEDVTETELEELLDRIQEKNEDVDIDVRRGNQPVYSFIIGVE